MAGSSARTRRLGAELRRLREAAGMTQMEVAAALGRSHPAIVSWERGRTRPSKSDLTCLLAEYNAPPEIRRAMEELRVAASRSGTQWVVYELPDWLRPLYSFEEDAVAISTFQALFVPGLLQTEDYARAVHLATTQSVRPEYVERWVQARVQRQTRLTGNHPLHVHAVIGEAALRIPAGGRDVIAHQLQHLLDMGHRKTATIQVLPFSAGALPGQSENFAVLHFAEPDNDPPLGYYDGPVGGHLISDLGDVASLVKTFDSLAALAANEQESADLISGILTEHQHQG